MVCWLTGRVRRCGPAPSWPSSTPPAGAARWSRTCSTGSTSTPCTATRPPTGLALNEIGRVQLRTTVPLFFDEYRRNRTTGSFVLVDEATNNTVGAGIILGPTEVRRERGARVAVDRTNVVWHQGAVARADRAVGGRHGVVHGPVGLGQVDGGGRGRAGRSWPAGAPAYLLDGDNVRHGLNADLGSAPPTAPRTSAAWARWPACSPTPAWWRWCR